MTWLLALAFGSLLAPTGLKAAGALGPAFDREFLEALLVARKEQAACAVVPFGAFHGIDETPTAKPWLQADPGRGRDPRPNRSTPAPEGVVAAISSVLVYRLGITRFVGLPSATTGKMKSPSGVHMRVLLIEDNKKLSQTIQVCLEQHGYCTDVAKDATDGFEIAFTERHDAIIVDVKLPDGDGVELCRRFRAQNINTPILILSVLAATADKVQGLDAGADDYMTKPFQTDELLARLRSLLRRSQAIEGGILKAGDLRLNLIERMVYIGDEPLRLSNKEIELLEYLMRNPRKLLSRTMISESVWDMNYEPTSNVIDVYVSSLRRKIDRGSVQHIETVIGSGYRFVADPVEEGPAAPSS